MDGTEAKQLLDPLARDAQDYEALNDGVAAVNGESDQREAPMSFRMRMIKTATMASLYVGLGFNSGVQSPSLLDMAGLFTNGNVEELGRAISIKAVGVLFGSFFGALIGDRFRKRADLFLFIIALINGLSCAATPWMPNVSLIGIMMFTQGICHGTFNVACCAINIAIWGERAAAPIHSLHMCYTLGYTLSQPVTGLFVVSQPSNSSASGKPSSTYNMFSSAGGHYSAENYQLGENTTVNGTRIYIPYGVFGAYQVILSFAFLVFFIMGLTYTSVSIDSRKSLREMFNLSSCTGGRGWYGVYMLVSLFFLYIGIVFREALLGLYVCTVGTYIFNMSGFKASLLGMAYNISLFVGRLVGMILALFIRIQLMVFVELIAVLVILVIISAVGFKVELCFWLLVCILGLFMGPNYPSVMAWADRYIEATGFVVAIIDTGIGVGAFIATFVGGVVLHRLDARWIFHLSTISAVFVLSVFIPLQIVSRKRGDRHTQLEVQYEADDSDEFTTSGSAEHTGETARLLE